MNEHEIVVDYRFVHDVESFFLEPGEQRSGEPVEAAWVFEIRGRRPDADWSTLARGAGGADLIVTAAIAVETIKGNMPDFVAGIAEHQITGSAATFNDQFAEAFDLRVGAPELIEDDIEEEHIWDD
jgi:hypothetical protein